MENFITQIPAYFNDELSPEAEATFEKELQNNPDLAQKVQKYRVLMQAMHTIESPLFADLHTPNPATASPEINAEVARIMQGKNNPASRWRTWLYINLACLSLVGLILAIRYCTLPTPPTVSESGRQDTTIAKAKSEQTDKQKSLPTQADTAQTKPKEEVNKTPLPTPPKKDSIVPKKDTLEVIAQNFERNASFDARITQSKSAVQPISVASPAIDQNFTKTIRFDFKDSKPENVSYTVEIINNDEQSIMTKTFALSEVPFEIDFSEQTRGLYYWRLRKNGVQVYLGRFLFRK